MSEVKKTLSACGFSENALFYGAVLSAKASA